MPSIQGAVLPLLGPFECNTDARILGCSGKWSKPGNFRVLENPVRSDQAAWGSISPKK
jgi:hypothetical protein